MVALNHSVSIYQIILLFFMIVTCVVAYMHQMENSKGIVHQSHYIASILRSHVCQLSQASCDNARILTMLTPS